MYGTHCTKLKSARKFPEIHVGTCLNMTTELLYMYFEGIVNFPVIVMEFKVVSFDLKLLLSVLLSFAGSWCHFDGIFLQWCTCTSMKRLHTNFVEWWFDDLIVNWGMTLWQRSVFVQLSFHCCFCYLFSNTLEFCTWNRSSFIICMKQRMFSLCYQETKTL